MFDFLIIIIIIIIIIFIIISNIIIFVIIIIINDFLHPIVFDFWLIFSRHLNSSVSLSPAKPSLLSSVPAATANMLLG